MEFIPSGIQVSYMVRMVDGNGDGVAGITYDQVTATFVWNDNTTDTEAVDATPSNADQWVEVTTGAFAGTGLYRLIPFNGSGIATINPYYSNTRAVLVVSATGAKPHLKTVQFLSNEISTYLDGIFSNTFSIMSSMYEILGLVHKNAVTDQTTHNAGGKLTACRIRVYSSAAQAADPDNNSPTYTYAITATYDGSNNLISYTSVRV